MADSIYKGLTIEFKGDTMDFDKGVSKINGEIKDLKAETKLLNRELKLDPNNLSKLEAKFKTLKQQETLLTKEIDEYKKALQGMDKGSAEFEKTSQKVRNLEIELGYTKKALEDLGGNSVSVALKQIGTALQNAGSKVEELGKKFAGLSTACAGILTAFAKLSYDVVGMADDINTLSKQTGLSVETLQEFKQVANLIDVDLNTLSKSAVYLTKNLGNKTALETYKELGVAVKDNSGAFRSTEGILFDTLKALQGVTDETERSMLASKLFGKSYSALGSILNDASVDFEEINKLVKENGLILSADQLNELNSINDSIDTLKMRVSAFATSLAVEFREPFEMFVDLISNIFEKVETFTKSLSTTQKKRILSVITIVASISPILIVLGKAISSVGKLISSVGSVINFLLPIVQSITSLIMANPLAVLVTAIAFLLPILYSLYQNCESFRNLVDTLWNKLKNALSPAFESLKKVVSSVVDSFKSACDWIKNLFNQFANTSVVQGITNAFSSLKTMIGGVVDNLKSAYNWVNNLVSKKADLQSVSSISYTVGQQSRSGGFGNYGAYASGGYGSLELSTTINVNNNGAMLTTQQAQQFGRQIVEYVNDKLGRRL